METNERILKFIDYKGMSVNSFERSIGKSTNYVRNSKSFTSNVLASIMEIYPELSIDWLITGKGEMLKSELPSIAPKINYSQGQPYYDVDFIGGFDLVENNQTLTPDYYIDFPPYNKDGVMWCNVTGHSMEPEINHGDTIAIKDTNETNINYLPFGEVYAIVTDTYRTIKRISKSEKEGFIRLVPTNQAPEYAPQDIPVEKIKKVYRVLGSVKRF